jgi:ADP-ribosylglycohydrolase
MPFTESSVSEQANEDRVHADTLRVAHPGAVVSDGEISSARSRIRGCLLGGAIGDALGARAGRRRNAGQDSASRGGAAAPRRFSARFPARITAATQLTLFTAEGLVRAHVRSTLKGICYPPAVVDHAYVRWLLTQGVTPVAKVASPGGAPWPDGWLMKERALWARRSPGKTTLAELAATMDLGERAQNLSDAGDAVMRVGPVGLLAERRGDDQSSPAFDLGADLAALTHGHPAATLSGGAFALLIALLMEGLEMRRAVDEMYRFLAEVPGSGFVTRYVDTALRLAAEGTTPTAERLESLGAGLAAGESFAMAVYCALVARDFEHGIQIATSWRPAASRVAPLVGSVLGVRWGAAAIPEAWARAVELREVIERVAEDLTRVREDTFDCAAEWDAYPGW